MDVDEFSDDGFDDVPDNALQELERNAIQLTQAAHANKHRAASHHDAAAPPQQQPQQQRLSSYGWEEEDDDLDTTEVTNGAGGVPFGRPVVDNTLQRLPSQQQQRRAAGLPIPSQIPRRPAAAAPLPNPRWNPAVDHSKLAVGATVPLHARPPGPSQRLAPHAVHASQFGRGGTPLPLPAGRRHAHASQASPSGEGGTAAGDMVSALQRRVRSLESELQSARGEASIIRAKAAKAQEEFDGHVARLKSLGAEQLERQKRMAEAAVAAEKSANTELRFLQQDMREVHGRARRKDLAGDNGGGGGVMTTPKKAAGSRGFADGFDEIDVAPSPSKGQGRGGKSSGGSVAASLGERTPSKGKRKRPVVDSPVQALETTSGDEHVVMGDGVERDGEARSTAIPVRVSVPAAPFEFLQLVLDHGTLHQQPPTFDTLSRFTFPSEPGRTFSSMIFEKLPLMGNPHRPMQLLVDFAELVISLWTRCVSEEFWHPIRYLVALVAFTLDLHTTSVAPLIAPSLVPIALATLYDAAKARGHLPESAAAAAAAAAAQGPLPPDGDKHMDTTQLLHLLYLCAVSCATAPPEPDSSVDAGPPCSSATFWRLVPPEMMLLLLTPHQNPLDVIATLDLLSTSVLPSSIGPLATEMPAVDVARATIQRVSAKLTEQSPTPHLRRAVRLAALRTLISFSTSPFGAHQLARHGLALPRLVHCLSASIDDLYDTSSVPANILPPPPPPLSSAPPPGRSAPQDLHLIISQTTLLLHRLVTDPATANVVDLSQKLSVSHGGSQRYLLSLGRLAFAEEDLVLEAGIAGEVVEAAHELLELAVTPDEAETVNEAFGA